MGFNVIVAYVWHQRGDNHKLVSYSVGGVYLVVAFYDCVLGRYCLTGVRVLMRHAPVGVTVGKGLTDC